MDNVRQGFLRASAVLVLNSARTGYPFACLEASIISAARTAGSAVLAARCLNGGVCRTRRLRLVGNELIARCVYTFLLETGWALDEGLGEHARLLPTCSGKRREDILHPAPDADFPSRTRRGKNASGKMWRDGRLLSVRSDDQCLEHLLAVNQGGGGPGGETAVLMTDRSAERAFREQARALDPILYSLAFRLCRDPAVARDMVQDTFERGLKTLPQLPPGTNLRAWLTTVLHHRIVDHCRAQARHASVSLETVAELAGDSTEESWARVSSDELLRALSHLPEKFRSVCELFLVERLSYEAIAHKLGISKNTVGTRLSRSKERLKALLCDGAEDVE